ncbi:MAG: energy transducer TonB [Myxococcota bacterium]
MKIPRVLLTAPVAFVVTFLLFLGMRALIEGARRADDGKGGARIGDFIRVPTDSITNKRIREMPKRKPPPKQPPPPQISTLNTGKPAKIDAPKRAFTAAGPIGGNFKPIGGPNPGAGPSDSEATPVVRVAPIYPRRAAERGIQGYATVKFKVGTAGQVVDPRIIKSEPPGTFDRAALKAVSKWKYKPKVVNGKPIEYPVTPVRLEFKL